MRTTRDRWARLALGVVLVMGLVLRCWQLTQRSIWFDEAFTWRMIQFPLGEMLHRITLDNNPPLHFVLMKCWSACLGDSLLALRSFSVLMGTVAVLGMFLFVRTAIVYGAMRDARRRPGEECRAWETAVVAAGLLAASAFQIRWSWDARPYALGTALAVLSSWALMRALEATGHARRWWYAYVALAALLAYTHYFGLLTLAAQGGFALWSLWGATGDGVRGLWRAPNARQAVWSFLLIGLCWLPWAPFFARQMAQVRGDFWIHPFQPWDLAHLVYQMFVEPEEASLTPRGSLWAFDLCALGWFALLWRPRHDAVYVAAAGLTPIVLSMVLSRLGIHVFLLRYFVVAQPFFLAGLAMLVGRIPFAIERRLMAGLLLAWSLLAWWEFQDKADMANRPGARAAAEWIAQGAAPGEAVVASSPFCYLPIRYHLRDRGACFLYQQKQPIPHYLGAAVLTTGDLISAEELACWPASRLWLVDTTNAGGVRAVPAMRLKQARQQVFPEVFGYGDLIVQEYVAFERPEHGRVSPSRDERKTSGRQP